MDMALYLTGGAGVNKVIEDADAPLVCNRHNVQYVY